MKTLRTVKLEVEDQLKSNLIVEASLETQLIIIDVLEIDPIDYALEGDREVRPQDYLRIKKLSDLRSSRMPMSQIFGSKEFWSLNFKVTKDTLTPRADSETLIENGIKKIPDRDIYLNILDMGTGTGCLLLALLSELPNSTGLGLDISYEALEVAKENAKILGFSNRCEFRISDWMEGVRKLERFDIIISNPPYIGFNEKNTLSPEVKEYEPDVALFSGEEGLDDYWKIASQVKTFIKPNGMIIMEIGYKQAATVKEIFISAGFNDVSVYKDLGQRDRCLLIKK